MNRPLKAVGRRRFLQGAGGSLLALPLLESTAADSQAVSPKRLAATGIFYGLMPHYFHPEKVGRDYEMTPLLEPLAAHRDDFTVFSGLDHNLGGGHNSTKYFLSGIPVTQAKGYAEANISVDQKAAQFVGGETRYPSLVLGCDAGQEHTLSWTRNGNAIPMVEEAERLYSRLFRKENAQSRARIERDFQNKQSILDLVRDQSKSFEKGLAASDKEKLDQYYTSVRELEGRIEQSERWLNREKPTTDYTLPEGIDELTLHDKTPFFYDLMVLALQTDSTRVISLSFTDLGKESGGIAGVSTGYHSLSHHGQVQSVMDELALVERFHTGQFSRFLDKLKEVKEPNGETLLDNTMALFGSGMSNGNSHSLRDLPVVLAGGGFKHGEHKHYARNGKTSVSLCNLYLTMLQHFGLEIDQFNNSTGTLTGFEIA